jgi:hypothetical protein
MPGNRVMIRVKVYMLNISYLVKNQFFIITVRFF